MKVFLLITVFSLQSFLLFGQGKATGIIVDKSTHAPLEYVNVQLYQQSNHQFISGTVTDGSGKFILGKIPWGDYELKYNFLGFEHTGVKTFSLTKNNPSIDLGTLVLAESTQNLDEVVVTGKKSTYISRIDKKVFNVGEDLISASGSVSDLMQNIPSVQVDIDGNVSLRGSDNVQILINGKASTLTGAASRATTLQQIPANTIDRIEVITNPSAKYKPDGTSGIINIILKKERRSGLNGTVTVNAGNDDRYNGTISLNYKPGKINFFGSYGVRWDDRGRYIYDNRTRIDSLSQEKTYIGQNTNSTARPFSQLFRGGADWDISRKDNLQLSGGYTYMSFLRNDNTTNIYRNSQSTTNNYTRFRTDDEYQKDAELSAVYQHTFGEDHTLSIDYTFAMAKEQEDNKYTNQYYFPVKPDSKDNTLIWEDERENLIRVDYTRPLNENTKLDIGTEIELDRADLNYSAENLVNNSWKTDTEKTNHFRFNENIYAVFATYEATFGKIGIMGGVRGEHADIKSRLITTDTVIPNKYWNLFPTMHTAYHFNDKNELQLNYSLRINRPEGDDLNPFPEYRDPFNVQSGNPHLKPEKIHSIELGYQRREKSTTFLATLYYREIFNRMTEVSHFVNDSVMWTTKENMSSSQSSGVEFIINSAIGKVATINFNSNVFYNVIDASDLGFSSKKSVVSWYAALNGNVTITKSLMAQMNARYTGKSLTPQGYREPSFIMYMGARYDLLDKKASILFTVSDVLNSFRRVTTIDTPYLKERVEQKRPSQIFYLGFVYNFGGSTKKAKEATLKYDEQL